MVSENAIEKHVPDIVGAIFKRLGRNNQAQEVALERFVLGGTIKHVEISRRTFALHRAGRHYCISWDDETDFIGTTASRMHGMGVVVRARANIVGLYAESIALDCDAVSRDGHFSVSRPPSTPRS